jgi:hypothetical protein
MSLTEVAAAAVDGNRSAITAMSRNAMEMRMIHRELGAWIADFRALCSFTFELPLPNVKLARSRAYPLIRGQSNKGRRGSQLDAWLSEGQVRIPVPHLL